MDKQFATCPRCGNTVELRHNGETQGANDFTSPWRFVAHTTDDIRGGVNFPRECTATGENVATARNSW